MAHAVHIEITAPFQLGDVVAEVTYDGGKTLVVLREGVADVTLPAPAKLVKLTQEDAPDGSELAPERSDLPAKQAPRGAVVPVDELFDHGVPVPADGSLVVQLAWGMPCASAPPPPKPVDGTRFGSWEHILTAEWMGLDQRDKPLLDWIAKRIRGDVRLPKDIPLPVGDKLLRFGEIIALSGDFYAHLDEVAAQTKEIADAWPAIGGVLGFFAGDYRETTLQAESAEAAEHILQIVFRDRDKHPGMAGEIATGAVDTLFNKYPLRRYGALASQNYCHFASQPWDGSIDDDRNLALKLYRLYHRRALQEAEAARATRDEAAVVQAIVVDGFACHFLTDLFASGHLRVPRRALTERLGIVRGGSASKAAHDEDNKGLWVRMRKAPGRQRVVWCAYGDNYLRDKDGQQHLAMVREAVRRSVEEVCARFTGKAPSGIAEDMLPVPLPSGQGPRPEDLSPDSVIMGPVHSANPKPKDAPATNAFPLWIQAKDGALWKRVGDGPTYKALDSKGTMTLGASA